MYHQTFYFDKNGNCSNPVNAFCSDHSERGQIQIKYCYKEIEGERRYFSGYKFFDIKEKLVNAGGKGYKTKEEAVRWGNLAVLDALLPMRFLLPDSPVTQFLEFYLQKRQTLLFEH